MGKMGEAANLGMVAIAAFVVWKLAGIKMPKLELPKFELPPPPGEFTGIPGPGAAPGVNIWNLFQNGGRDVNGVDDHALDSDLVETLERLTTREFVELPDIPPIDVKPPAYYESKLEVHRARLEHYEEVSSVLVPGIESQLAALQANVGELSYMVKGHDAGGDIDMTRTDVGAMLKPL